MGIFISVDPLAEKYKGWSSYAYALNNPVFYTDPTGMNADPPTGVDARNGQKYMDGTGTWIYDKASTTWVGQYGNKYGTRSRDIGNTIQLENVNVKAYKSNYVSSGEYGPDKDPNHALMAAGMVALPALALGGAFVGAFALFGEMSAGAVGGRMAIDATVQTGVNFSTNGGDFGNAIGRVNLTQVGLSGLGMNYVGNAFLSASTNMSLIDQSSIFNGTISAQQFTTQSIFSIAGGKAAQNLNGSSWFKGATLGADMFTTVCFGQSTGNAVGKVATGVLTNAPVFGAGVIQNEMQ